MHVTVVQWSRSCLNVQINRVRLPATLFSVSFYRFFPSLVSFFNTNFTKSLNNYICWTKCMTSRFSSKNKEKKAKRKNSVKTKKKKKKNRYKETENGVAGSQPGLPARASNCLTTAPQWHTWLEKLKVWSFILERDFKSSWSAYWPSLRPEKNHRLSRHVPPLKQLTFSWHHDKQHSTPVTHWRDFNFAFCSSS